MDYVFRQAVTSDAAALTDLAERTFRDAFASLNTAENMDLHCATAFRPEVQAAEIGNPEMDTVVVEADGRLVAFAQLHRGSPTPSSVSATPAVELRRIYVEREFHGTGLARDLMANMLERARDRGAAAMWLGVWEHNPRAIRFYQRFGFSEVGEHVFSVGTDPQRDLVMLRSLTVQSESQGGT